MTEEKEGYIKIITTIMIHTGITGLIAMIPGTTIVIIFIAKIGIIGFGSARFSSTPYI